MANLDQFYILVPESTENLCTNPSFETGTTSWSANGGSIAQSTTRARFGRYSLQHTPSSTSTSSVRLGTFTHTLNATLTGSCYGYWENGVEYRMRFLTSGGAGYGNVTVWTGAGRWEYKEVTSTSSASSSQFEIGKSGGTGTASTNPYWIDGVNVEEKAYATTYCDGDQDGCYWQFTPHASKSSRFANYRAAGRKVGLPDYDAYITDLGGVGAPPVEVVVTPYGYADGGVFQKTNVRPRQFALTLSVRGDDLNDWQINQEAIFDMIKPDLVYPEQPFILGWQENGNDVEIACKYAGGLELQGEKLRDIGPVALSLIAADPYWYEPVENNKTLTNADRLNLNAYLYRMRPDGTMTDICPSGAPNGDINVALRASDGYIYIGGNFTTLNSQSLTRIARYNPQTGVLSAVGSGYNGAVKTMVESNGILFVGGAFTTANGVTCNGISMITLSTTTFSTNASISGPTGTPDIRSIAIQPERGIIYIGGQWVVGGTTFGTRSYDYINNTVNPVTMTIAHSTPANLAVNQILNDNNFLYYTGAFTSVGGSVTTNGIAVADVRQIATATWSALGSGMSTASGPYIILDRKGGLYATTSAGTIGGTGATSAYWNGSSWASIPASVLYSGLGKSCVAQSIGDVFTNSSILQVGTGQLAHSGIIKFNGTAAEPQSLMALVSSTFLPPATTINPMLHDIDGSLYVTADTAATDRIWLGAITTVTNNGSASVFPKITIVGPTTAASGYSFISYIRNLTTNQVIIFNTYLVPGETLTIDLTSDNKTVISNLRGPLPNAIYPGGNFSEFCLAPGNNSIDVGVFDEDDPSSAVVYMTWRERHWTFHGGHI